MTKSPSDLPSQGAALLAAMERQQRDWQTRNRALAKGPLARDFLCITDAIEMERKRRDLAFRALTKSPGMMAFERMVRITELHQRRFAAIGRAVEVSSLVKDIRRVGLAFSKSTFAKDIGRVGLAFSESTFAKDIGRAGLASSESVVGRDCRRIAATLQAQQERALKTERLLVISAAFQALEQINRATELHQRQLKSIVRAAGNNSFAYAIKQMSLTFSRSAFAKDLRRITDAARLMQAQMDSAHRALRASLDFSPLERSGASLLRGLRQSLTAAAETVPVPSPQDAQEASRAASTDNAATVSSPHAVGTVSEEAHIEWRVTIFLAKLPAYFAPSEDPPPKHRLH